MIGRTIAQYRILERIGSGGMGVVYKAEDLRLQRTVALKFISDSIASDPASRDKLLVEARAASRLDHPNVVTVYEIGEAEGECFICMAYVEGRSLRSIIDSHAAGVTESIGWAMQIANGLAAAHRKGIVHLDLKPSNVLITHSGEAKLADFGLSRVERSDDLSPPAIASGTSFEYMSPEQAWGRPVDRRSDIYSLGAILFELITGRPPFTAVNLPELVYSILNETPPLDQFGRQAPGVLVEAISRALAKDPERRYQTVEQMRDDLQKAHAASCSVPRQGSKLRNFAIVAAVLAIVIILGGIYASRHSNGSPSVKIAVRDFHLIPAQPGDYLATCFTRDLAALLGRMTDLKVVGNTDQAQVGRPERSRVGIAGDLGVDYLVEGNIVRDTSFDPAGQLTVSIRLYGVVGDTTIWRSVLHETADRQFEIQQRTVVEIEKVLGLPVSNDHDPRWPRPLTRSVQARSLFEQARINWMGDQREQTARNSIALCEEAVALDSGFAAAIAWQSIMYSALRWYGYDLSDSCAERARTLAVRSVSLDETGALGELATGYYYYWGRRDYEDAAAHFARARRMAPFDVSILHAQESVLRRIGDWEAAIQTLRLELEVDPGNALSAATLGELEMRLRQYASAERDFDLAIARDSGAIPAWLGKCRLYVLWDGSTKRSHGLLNVVDLPLPRAQLEGATTLVDLCDGNYEDAAKHLMRDSTSLASYYLTSATILRGLNKDHDAQAYYDSARSLLETFVTRAPGTPDLYSQLGLAYAGLGRKSEAIHSGRLALGINPVTRDAWDGPKCLEAMAEILVRSGEQDQAIDCLERLAAIPADFSVRYLRLDAKWKPLRNNPRFQKLISSSATTAGSFIPQD